MRSDTTNTEIRHNNMMCFLHYTLCWSNTVFTNVSSHTSKSIHYFTCVKYVSICAPHTVKTVHPHTCFDYFEPLIGPNVHVFLDCGRKAGEHPYRHWNVLIAAMGAPMTHRGNPIPLYTVTHHFIMRHIITVYDVNGRNE